MTFLAILYWTLIVLSALFLIFCIKEAILNEPTFFRNKNETHIFKKTQKNLEIQNAIKSLPGYRPNVLLPGAWLKLGLVKRPLEPFNFFTRKIYRYKDGGEVALDFYPPLVESKLVKPTPE